MSVLLVCTYGQIHVMQADRCELPKVKFWLWVNGEGQSAVGCALPGCLPESLVLFSCYCLKSHSYKCFTSNGADAKKAIR